MTIHQIELEPLGSPEPQGNPRDGRAPPESQEDLKHFMRCESICYSTGIGNRLYRSGITRCFCCFDCCFGFVQQHLISDGRTGQYNDAHTNRMEETEEWFRGFNCWPLPWLTLAMCSFETYHFIMLSNADNYLDALLATNLAWTKDSKYEIHRLV